MSDRSLTGRDVLRRSIAGQRARIGAATLLMGSHQTCEALVPVVIGLVVDHAIDRSTADAGDRSLAGDLQPWIALLAVLFLILSMSYRFGARKAEAAAEWAAHDLRMQLGRRILDPAAGAEAGRLPGELTNVATSDAGRVGAVNSALPAGFGAVVAVLVAGVALLRLSVPLGLLVLVGAPVLLGLVQLLGRPLEKRSEAEQDRAAVASGVAADLVSGLRVLKGIGAAPTAVARYRRTSQDALGATLRAAWAGAGYEGAMLGLSSLFLAGVALFGTKLALDGDISVGELVAAVGLGQFLISPMQYMAWVTAELARGRASATRVAAVLSSPPAITAGTGAPAAPVAGGLHLRHGGSDALAGLDLRVHPGELLGVVAPDPATAGALLRCLGRDTDTDGVVLLDGTDLSTLAPDEVRGAVLVAAHDAMLFGGTLRSNLGAGDLAPALAASGADEVTRTLPGGLDGTLTERGGNLSGGQRQRVALARALAADPPVLVLHDPTTAVDSVTEARIAAGLAGLRRGRTTILVTTSPALLAVADRVVLLSGGALAGSGHHADLLRDSAAYREAVLA